jgi:hypothetical protein
MEFTLLATISAKISCKKSTTVGTKIPPSKANKVNSIDKSDIYELALWVSFTAGALADIIANVFVVPIEVVVSRLQIQEPNSTKKYKGSIGKNWFLIFNISIVGIRAARHLEYV